MSDESQSISSNLIENSISTINPDPCYRSLESLNSNTISSNHLEDSSSSIDSEMTDRSLHFDSIDEDLGKRMLNFNRDSSYSFDDSMSSFDGEISKIILDLNSVSSSYHLDNSIESGISDRYMEFDSCSSSGSSSSSSSYSFDGSLPSIDENLECSVRTIDSLSE